MAHFFVSYAHADNESPNPGERWLDRLLSHIKPLVQQKMITTWSDNEIRAGTKWEETIRQAIDNANAAVLLVSPAFLASDFIRRSELPRLLAQAQSRGGEIIPVMLRPCLFDVAEYKYPDPETGPETFKLSSIQSVNSPDRALSKLSQSEQDEILNDLGRRLMEIARQNP